MKRSLSEIRATVLGLGLCLGVSVGCGGGSDGADEADGGGGGGEAAGGGVVGPDVPWEGDLPTLPAGAERDVRTYFPVDDGGVWRYRRESPTPAMPGPIEQGGQATMRTQISPDDERDLEAVRETVSILDLPGVDGEPSKKIRQVLKETYLVTPGEGQVGPEVRFKKIDIEEREVGTDRFVRTLTREYDPPYTLIEDAFAVGTIFTEIMQRPRVTETRQELGDEMPEETSFIAEVRVTTQTEAETLLMERKYREGVRQIDVYDDVSQTLTRTMWVQPGVGIVQWIYRDATGLRFTLTETNLEPLPSP
ncbi:MAG: hypothetical protein ACOYM9_06005 [Bradymonadia bacterium]|jgi:hypothetical protein